MYTPPPPIAIEIEPSNEPGEQVSATARPFSLAAEAGAWVGSAAILAAYIAELNVETEFVLNLGGSLLILVVCLKRKVYQPALLNAAWAVGSIYKHAQRRAES